MMYSEIMGGLEKRYDHIQELDRKCSKSWLRKPWLAFRIRVAVEQYKLAMLSEAGTVVAHLDIYERELFKSDKPETQKRLDLECVQTLKLTAYSIITEGRTRKYNAELVKWWHRNFDLLVRNSLTVGYNICSK